MSLVINFDYNPITTNKGLWEGFSEKVGEGGLFLEGFLAGFGGFQFFSAGAVYYCDMRYAVYHAL